MIAEDFNVFKYVTAVSGVIFSSGSSTFNIKLVNSSPHTVCTDFCRVTISVSTVIEVPSSRLKRGESGTSKQALMTCCRMNALNPCKLLGCVPPSFSLNSRRMVKHRRCVCAGRVNRCGVNHRTAVSYRGFSPVRAASEH